MELEREKVEGGACVYCMGSVDCGMKSEREESIERFKQTLGKESAITLLSLLRCSMVQSH